MTANGINRLNHWLGKMHLKKEDKIRIVVRGHIRAFATIKKGEPYALPISEICGEWGSAIDLVDIDILIPPYPSASCAHLQGSHRFDGTKTSLLDH